MAASLEQQIVSAVKSDTHTAVDSLSNMFNDAYKSVTTVASQEETTASKAVSDVHLPTIDLFDSAKTSTKPEVKTPTAPEVKAPVQSSTSHPSLLTEVGNVATQLGKGALNEIEQHPLQLVETAAVGVAVGVAATFLAPELLIGAAVVGIGYAAYEGYKHMPAMVHDTEVVANPNAYSAQDVAQATQCVQDFGGAALNDVVGIAAGAAGGMLGSTFTSATTDVAIAATDSPAATMPASVEPANYMQPYADTAQNLQSASQFVADTRGAVVSGARNTRVIASASVAPQAHYGAHDAA